MLNSPLLTELGTLLILSNAVGVSLDRLAQELAVPTE